MADEGKTRFEIPWATLLPLVAALAGVLAQFRPLVSARPSVPNGKSIEYTAAQDVDARLWQDPLTVAQKAKEQLETDLLRSKVASSRVEKHLLPALVKSISDEAQTKPVLILAVMLDAGPYIEQEEARLRVRQGVLEALNESGFVPNDSEHIGFVTIAGKPVLPWQGKPGDEMVESGSILIPWEQCDAAENAFTFPPTTRRVFVLWLPASSFGSRPLEAFADKLVRPLREASPANLTIKLIGPANSTGLAAMVREGPDEKNLEPTPYDLLDGVEIISPRATASDEAILGGTGEVASKLASYVRNPVRGGLRFLRTVKDDDVVLTQLIDELARRRIYVAPRESKGKWLEGERVVILSEWDNPYGRLLAKRFARLARNPANDEVQSNVFSYRYMHGIDGRLPGDPARGPDNAKPSANQLNAVSAEATEGVDRSDFLRRLALQLKEKDRELWREGKPGVRAIGLLGSDVFDKLLILRALRPEFPDALFFTNNFDAHFERRDDWSDVRNLVIASPFGSRISTIKSSGGSELPVQQQVAPFRDNNQTAMFFGTLVATGKVDERSRQSELDRQPRLYEIGRHGAQELYRAEAGPDSDREWKNAHWFRDWLLNRHAIWPLAIATCALLLLTAWISLSIVDRRAVGGGALSDRLRRVCTSTSFLLVCGVPMIVLAVGLFAQKGGAIEEPLAFFSGISIWPSEMLRLIALMLAVHFMLKARLDLHENEKEITRQFFPDAKIADEWRLDLGLRRWQKEHPEWVTGGATVPAEQAWSAYLRRNRFWPRFIRITALTVMYAIFSVGFYLLFPNIVVPARGRTAFIADLCVLVPTVLATMVLTFYVVDAIRLNSNFIRILTRSATEWGAPLAVAEGRIPPLEPKDLARYYDLSFVARRSEAVAPLIWYPLIVLAVSFVARSSIFDHWTWPISLVTIFTLNAAWAFGSAIFLRRSAEQLRSAALRNLQLARLKSYRDPDRRATFDDLISEVRGVRSGAFAPLSEQPFIRAIIYPSGGIGLLAVAQRLLDIF